MADQQVTSTDLRRDTVNVLAAVDAGHHQHVTTYDTHVAVIVPPDWYRYAAACIERVQQLDAAFNCNTVRVPKPNTPEGD